MIESIKCRNVVTQKEITIEKSAKVFVLDEIDWDSPSVSMESYRVPYQVGQTLAGVTVGTRKPTVTGYVVADTSNINPLGKKWSEYLKEQEQQIEESKIELDKMFSVYQDVIIEANGYYITGRPTQPPKYSTKEEDNNEIMCYFKLEFECYSPLFYSTSKMIELATTAGEGLHFPLIIPSEGVVFGKIEKKQSINITNNGDSDVGCTIKVGASGGVVKNPKIYNVNTGQYISFDDVTLQDGDYITITTSIGEENAIHHVVETSTDVSLIGNISIGSEFIQIKQGSYYYAYEVDKQYENNIDVSIEFTERYFNIRGM